MKNIKLITVTCIFAIAMLSCKKKESTPEPSPQPTTTGSVPTQNTVKVVYTPGGSYGYLSIKWEYDYNTASQDSLYVNPGVITKTRIVQGDSVKIDWLCKTSSTVFTVTPATVDVYVNNVLKQSYQNGGQEAYIKIK